MQRETAQFFHRIWQAATRCTKKPRSSATAGWKTHAAYIAGTLWNYCSWVIKSISSCHVRFRCELLGATSYHLVYLYHMISHISADRQPSMRWQVGFSVRNFSRGWSWEQVATATWLGSGLGGFQDGRKSRVFFLEKYLKRKSWKASKTLWIMDLMVAICQFVHGQT